MISRDDLTGSALSGNKVRKLEFLLAEAVQQGRKEVITVGGLQSNHCRATCVSCRRVGLNPSVVLGTSLEPNELPIEGNVIFDKFVGANIFTVPRGMTRAEVYAEKTMELDAYAIPVGGSNRVGTWGYIEKWNEWLQDGVLDKPNNIFIPVGSGGTAAGIIIGNYLTGSKHNIHLLQVADTVASLTRDIETIIQAFSLDVTQAMANVTMYAATVFMSELISLFVTLKMNTYKAVGGGYAVSTDDELEFICRIGRETGLIFDRVYSGKALKVALDVMKKSDAKNWLFLHTGGIHSISDSTVTKFLTK